MLPKRAASARTRGPRRALVAPGEVALVPEGMLALFARIVHFVVPGADGKQEIAARFLVPQHPAILAHFDDLAELETLAARFNAGERFLPAPQKPE
ncbi:hypothetical protein ACU4GI_32665 [Cupriavidus basilensis]